MPAEAENTQDPTTACGTVLTIHIEVPPEPLTFSDSNSTRDALLPARFPQVDFALVSRHRMRECRSDPQKPP